MDLFELEGVPGAARMLLLAACDRHQAALERSEADPRRVVLRLQLPTRPDPRSYADWTWVACPISLPVTVPAGAALHLPTLHVRDGRVRAEITFTHAVPQARHRGHAVALGVDRGLKTLLPAGAACLHPDGRITTLGSGARFRAAGVLAKQHRLRRLSEHLHAKSTQHQHLLDGRAPSPALPGGHALSAEEARRVSARRAHLNGALAWAAARWTVDQALTAHASVIYLEDLRSLEASGMGRTLNTRLSQTVRGRIAHRIRHLAAEAGIAVVTLPARNTSRHCPRCLTVLRHCKAPDRPAISGWKGASCPNPACGWQGDRDQGAWQRIAARGLTHQTQTSVERTTATMAIRSVSESLEAQALITPNTPKTDRTDRSKTGPTRRSTTCPAPRRRRAPSPARPLAPAGQRPEGPASTDRPLPRAAHRHQGGATTSTPTTRHRPRGAALGAGFHLHVHATPPRWETIPGTMSSLGSLSWSETLEPTGDCLA
ncbi:zinc ribbon domain-containing protein [Nonomuraea phyllanthi]|uniref:zinc ribbon domain-containing protein n=1 Tax=Nonomuraea phyllanthi TaxID=2219224 RepID=UPI001D01F67C|nr:zinc ribbon domain-containing protein [Nonomuraea phyllanthi]